MKVIVKNTDITYLNNSKSLRKMQGFCEKIFFLKFNKIKCNIEN